MNPIRRKTTPDAHVLPEQRRSILDPAPNDLDTAVEHYRNMELGGAWRQLRDALVSKIDEQADYISGLEARLNAAKRGEYFSWSQR